MQRRVSVLIPIYNRFRYIEECLQSVFRQSHGEFKVVIYDDGSTDNTIEVIRQFRKNLALVEKGKLQVLEGGVNRGVGHARNALLAQLDTPYACWQDSDDLMNELRLEHQLECLIRNHYEMVYCYMQKIDEKGERQGTITVDVGQYNRNIASLKNNVACPTGLFVHELKHYPVPVELTLGGEDILWLYQLVCKSRKIGCCNEELYSYRYHEARIGHAKRLTRNASIKLQETKVVEQLIHDITGGDA